LIPNFFKKDKSILIFQFSRRKGTTRIRNKIIKNQPDSHVLIAIIKKV